MLFVAFNTCSLPLKFVNLNKPEKDKYHMISFIYGI